MKNEKLSAKNIFRKGIWVNDIFMLKDNLNKQKPCYKCGYCPYGQLVECYPLKHKTNKYSCLVFGHDCPIFYQAEDVTETDKLNRIKNNNKNAK